MSIVAAWLGCWLVGASVARAQQATDGVAPPASTEAPVGPEAQGLVELVATVTTAPMEVGTVRKIGLGAAVGIPTSLTVQGWVKPKVALTAHVGPTLSTSGLSLRVQVEGVAAELAHWPLGRLRLLGHGGVDVIALFGRAGEGLPVRFGVHGGAGVDFVPRQFPVTGFAEVAPVFYPLDVLPGARFSPVGINVAGGVRVFLAPSRARAEPVAPASERRKRGERVREVGAPIVPDNVGGQPVVPVELDEPEAPARRGEEAVPIPEPGHGGVTVDHPPREPVEADLQAGDPPIGDVGSFNENAGHGVPPVGGR